VSLTGSVEDLPLLEILQVVAFCQKTGHLTVKAPEGQAAVVFREGRVVSGYIWDEPPLELGEVEVETRQKLISERITSTLQRLVRLREGEFGFAVSATAPSRVGDRDLSGETLEEGINPEGLMLDLARQLDEDRREAAAAVEASFSSLPSREDDPPNEALLEELLLEEAKEPSAPSRPPVLLVDDEPDVLRLVGEQLRAEGFEVVEASEVRAGRRGAARLAQRGEPFLLVTDLGLPSLSGANFRGGLEVASYASALEPRPRVLLMAERGDETLRKKARRLGVSILALKPGLSKLDPQQYEKDLLAFGETVARDLVPRLQRRGGDDGTAPRPAPVPPPLPAPADEASSDVVLQAVVDELQKDPEPDQIAFLLLRAARAFLPRAILFLVEDDVLRGLAGFGPTESGASLDVMARELSVSLDEPSPFVEAVAPGRVWRGAPSATGPVGRLLASVGSLDANSAVVIPVRAQRDTIAVLWGDNPGGRPLPDPAALLDFADRAGRALDEAFLAQRVGGPAA
jgi:CheY-like chemotaxis protein